MADADINPATPMPGQVESAELGPAETSLKEKEQAVAKRSDPLTRIEERLDTIVKKLDEALSLKQTYGPLRPKEEMSPLPPSTWPKTFPSLGPTCSPPKPPAEARGWFLTPRESSEAWYHTFGGRWLRGGRS